MKKKNFLAALFFSALVFGAFSQSVGANVDLNTYYQYPLSVGFEYQSLTPFTSLNGPYSIFDAAGTVTMPIPWQPVFQPFARLG